MEAAGKKATRLLSDPLALTVTWGSRSEAWGASRASGPIRWLAVRASDSSGAGYTDRDLTGLPGERNTPIPIDDIVYVFIGSAVRRGLIQAAAWAEQVPLKPTRVYVRTTTNLYVAYDRALDELQERLPPALFLRIHQSLLANLEHVGAVDSETRSTEDHTLEMRLAGDVTERLTVSRRAQPRLRERFGMPRRERRRPAVAAASSSTAENESTRCGPRRSNSASNAVGRTRRSQSGSRQILEAGP